MKKISKVETIVFYDVANIIVGEENEDSYYLALLYDITSDGDLKYIAVHLNKEVYESLRFNSYDLRDAILSNDVYLASYGNELIVQDEIITPTEDMLPDAGFKF